MSAYNDLSCLAFSELNKIVCALCMVDVVQVSGLFIIGSDAYCNFLIHIINFSQSKLPTPVVISLQATCGHEV